MKDIESIDIVFENCEYINIKTEDIIWLSLENINQSIHRVACNSISKFISANEIEIVLKKDLKLSGAIWRKLWRSRETFYV